LPITWKISADERLVQARADGPVTLKDIENYLDAVVMADAQPYAKLFDASTMVLRLSDDELMLLGARMSAYGSAFAAAGPLAFVATTLAVQGFAKRFLNVASSVQRPSKLCKTVDEAKAWLQSRNSR
jgi:hypothetical protein